MAGYRHRLRLILAGICFDDVFEVIIIHIVLHEELVEAQKVIL
jgi:hypothetical protein